MDSFAQQMLDEIDRRCTEYHLSNTIIRLDNESNERKNSDESESIPKNKVEKVSLVSNFLLFNFFKLLIFN